MAKDDYYVIVAKILVFLYKKLKNKTDKDIVDYIVANTPDFPIDDDYMKYVLTKMYERGMIENLRVTKAWGEGVIDIEVLSRTQITPEGIDYLRDNDKIRKCLNLIPEAVSIASLFA